MRASTAAERGRPCCSNRRSSSRSQTGSGKAKRPCRSRVPPAAAPCSCCAALSASLLGKGPLGSQLGQHAGHGPGKVRVQFAKPRQNIVPNAVAGIVVGKIGAIGAVGLAQQGQVFLHLSAGHIQQRTDDVAPRAGDAAQPVQTGAPYQVHQHRFDGIIQSVGGGDAPPPLPFRQRNHNGRCGRLPPPKGGFPAPGRRHQYGGQHRAVPAARPPPAQTARPGRLQRRAARGECGRRSGSQRYSSRRTAKKRKRATESAPPETPTAILSPWVNREYWRRAKSAFCSSGVLIRGCDPR